MWTIYKRFCNNKNISVGGNANTPVETQKFFADDREEQVRVCVADNPNTPAVTLIVLANDEDEFVRGGAADNPNTI